MRRIAAVAVLVVAVLGLGVAAAIVTPPRDSTRTISLGRR